MRYFVPVFFSASKSTPGALLGELLTVAGAARLGLPARRHQESGDILQPVSNANPLQTHALRYTRPWTLERLRQYAAQRLLIRFVGWGSRSRTRLHEARPASAGSPPKLGGCGVSRLRDELILPLRRRLPRHRRSSRAFDRARWASVRHRELLGPPWFRLSLFPRCFSAPHASLRSLRRWRGLGRSRRLVGMDLRSSALGRGARNTRILARQSLARRHCVADRDRRREWRKNLRPPAPGQSAPLTCSSSSGRETNSEPHFTRSEEPRFNTVERAFGPGSKSRYSTRIRAGSSAA